MSNYNKEDLAIWLKGELKDLVADRKHIDESDMPLFNRGLDWVCALDTKVEKILTHLAIPDLYEALKKIRLVTPDTIIYDIANTALAKAEEK